MKLPITDSYQRKLEDKIIKNFQKFENKKINLNSVNIYMNKFTENVIQYGDSKKNKFPLCLYSIRKENVVINKKYKESVEKGDERVLNILNLFKKTIHWAKKNKLRVPDCDVYFWIMDKMPYLSNDLDDFPLWVFSKPIDKNYILSPNDSFECFHVDKKYRGKCYDWDEIKNKINKNCKIPFEKKKQIIYFKGAKTTILNSKLREKLEETHKELKIPLKIDLDVWKNYEPIYNLCKYKILLDLPGRAPWSIRTQFLHLMKSIIIHVDSETITNEYHDRRFITFADYIVSRSEFVSITYKYYHKNKEKNELEFKKFIVKLEDTYEKILQKEAKYQRMAERAYEKMNTLTNERIYQCVYLMFKLQSKIKF